MIIKHPILSVIVSAIILCGVLLAFWVGGTILQNSGSDTPAFHQSPDYLIILGCRLEGEQPGNCLTERIDSAAEYLNANPECMAVASGGQGDDEVISEAESIARALEEWGIAPHRILKEDRSSSTRENFAYSKELLDAREGEHSYLVAFATSDFHVYRSRKLAEQAGFETPIALSVPSSPANFYLNFLREIPAVLAQVR